MLLDDTILKPVNAIIEAVTADEIDDGFPLNAIECPHCRARAYIKSGGCAQCLDCGFGFCEI